MIRTGLEATDGQKGGPGPEKRNLGRVNRYEMGVRKRTLSRLGQQWVEVVNYNEFCFDPSPYDGLEEVIIFQDGEHIYHSGEMVPNGSVWRFVGASYRSQILGQDVGCGMSAWVIMSVDVPKAMDAIAEHLKGSGVLRSGNHYVELLAGFEREGMPETQILLIHCNGRTCRKGTVSSYLEAVLATREAEDFRNDLGEEIIGQLGTTGHLMGNWTHDSVEEARSGIIYRKGVLKIEERGLYLLPAHLNAKALLYTTWDEATAPGELMKPPMDSLPSSTGRSAGCDAAKVSLEQAGELRKLVYIPECIQDASLRTEHPACFNGYDSFCKHFHPYIIGLESFDILGYAGKI